MADLGGRTVVLTRPEGRAAALHNALSAQGAVVIEVPLLEVIAAPDGGASLHYGIGQLRPGEWIALTSAAAVGGLVAAASVGELSAFQFAAVGDATAEALRSAGLTPGLVGDGRGGGALAQQIPAPRAPGERILLAVAAEPMANLGEGLRAAGYETIEATAYATVPVKLSEDQRGALGRAEVLVLSSPKGVRLAVEALGAVRPAVVALGPTTATAARECGFTSLVTAVSPGTAGVMAAIGTLLGTA